MNRLMVFIAALACSMAIVASESDRRIIQNYEARGAKLPPHLQKSKTLLAKQDQKRAKERVEAQQLAALREQTTRPYGSVSPQQADYQRRIQQRNERLTTLPSRTGKSLRAGAQRLGEFAGSLQAPTTMQPAFGPYVEDVSLPIEESAAALQQREYEKLKRQQKLARDPYADSPLRSLRVMHTGGEEKYMRQLEEQKRIRERQKQGYYGVSTPKSRRAERLGAYGTMRPSPLHEQYMYIPEKYTTPAMREGYEMYKTGAPLTVEPIQAPVERAWYERWITAPASQFAQRFTRPAAKPTMATPYQRMPSLRTQEYSEAFAPTYSLAEQYQRVPARQETPGMLEAYEQWKPSVSLAPQPTMMQRAQPYWESVKAAPGRAWSGISSGSQNLYRNYLGEK
jgi:hypothetical protein